MSDQGRRLSGLGERCVPRGERRRDLACEDRERKVPGTDAGEDATPIEPQLIAFPGRPGESQRRAKVRTGALGVVAQIINRLAQFGHAVGH